jgi:hypothetical protein
MPRFEVVIRGEGLERGLAALNDAGIPTLGPAFTWYGDQSEPPLVGNFMFAVLDAGAPGEAESRVSAVLQPLGGDFRIERGKAFDPKNWTDRG